ncbi:MAG TPA: replication-relaxation family protein [Anaeromyxobacteraceae bacterium]|nr:replication-relaxation family protein [Anaeromyxobacteraceae bacterium]
MARSKGAILTERDRVLLSYVGIARYATADQVHRLLFEGRSKKQTYRRLAKLCAPGGGLGEGACLRRLEFRRAEGTAVPVWALSSYGRGIVGPIVPYLRPPAAHDIGHRFLEHTLVLNEVPLNLVLKLRSSDLAPLASLPFRWLSEDDGTLQFKRYEHQGATAARVSAVLKPDAIVEVPHRKRRLFLEAETGTQSIATAHPARSGAIVAKLRRYASFFGGLTDARSPETWYRRAYPDGFVPRVVFLVHSDERKKRVEEAVKAEMTASREREFAVLVFTFAEAATVLAPYILEGRLQSTAVPTKLRHVTVDDRKVDELYASWRTVNITVGNWAAARRAAGVKDPAPPALISALQALRAFIGDDLGGDEPWQGTANAGSQTAEKR